MPVAASTDVPSVLQSVDVPGDSIQEEAACGMQYAGQELGSGTLYVTET